MKAGHNSLHGMVLKNVEIYKYVKF